MLFALSFSACASGNKDRGIASQTEQQTATPPAQLYWTGDGGKEISLGIIVPESQGLNADQAYLPTMVQGVLVANVSKYSAISVLDRVSLDKVIAETLDPTYEDNLDIVRLGHVAHVGNMMTGKIIRTSTGYTLQINVTDTTPNARTIASYSGTCSVAELDNHTAIQKASVELLAQMGVQLTDSAKNELSASNSQSVNAQTALAQGITAQRQGTEIAALSYYFQAAAFDPALAEAASRSSIMNASISSGNIGADTRNEIQWRRDWVARLMETEEFVYRAINTGIPSYTLFYSTAIERGAINFQTESTNLSFPVNLRASGAWFNSIQRAVQTVYDGLNATGRKNDWGLANWPQQGLSATNPFATQNRYDISVVFELVNDQNKVIGRQTVSFRPVFRISRDRNDRIAIEYTENTFNTVTFNAVNANDISNTLTIHIFSVNGSSPQNARFQITSLSRSKWQEYRTSDLVDLNHLIIENGVLIGFKRTLSDNQIQQYRDLVIPAEIWGEPTGITSISYEAFSTLSKEYLRRNQLTSVIIGNSVITIGNSAFRNNQLTGVTIPDSVISIGDNAFSENRLNSVTIPDSVISIGDNAFSGNPLTSVTIGNSVRYIGDNAFYTNLALTMTSVIIGSNVRIGKNAFAKNNLRSVYPQSTGFENFYNRNGKKAGVYTYNGSRWSYSPR